MNPNGISSINPIDAAAEESLENEAKAKQAFIKEHSIGPASAIIAEQIYLEHGGYVAPESLSISERAGLLSSQAADLWTGRANAGEFQFPENKK